MEMSQRCGENEQNKNTQNKYITENNFVCIYECVCLCMSHIFMRNMVYPVLLSELTLYLCVSFQFKRMITVYLCLSVQQKENLRLLSLDPISTIFCCCCCCFFCLSTLIFQYIHLIYK